ncbi:ion channel [Desulfosporosinus fructosivorans]
MDYYGTYPLKPTIIRGYKPPFPNSQNCPSPSKQLLPLNPSLKLGYWELLSPALVGAAGALFLSLFSDTDNAIERCEDRLFKLAIVWYGIGATVSVSFAVTNLLANHKAPSEQLLYPIAGALVSIILLFGAEFLLLYRFFPSSFKGDVGDDVWTQFFSFIYLSITTLATADLGDILPANITARALIATEITFNLFIIASAIQILLSSK